MEASEHQSHDEGSATLPDRPDIEWLAIGKRAGLSFDEMNYLRLRDLSAFVEAIVGEDTEAGQADIDALLR